jgi:hypothetical protein
MDIKSSVTIFIDAIDSVFINARLKSGKEKINLKLSNPTHCDLRIPCVGKYFLNAIIKPPIIGK